MSRKEIEQMIKKLVGNKESNKFYGEPIKDLARIYQDKTDQRHDDLIK